MPEPTKNTKPPAKPWPTWKKALVGVAAVLVVAGAAIQVHALATAPEPVAEEGDGAAAPRGATARAGRSGVTLPFTGLVPWGGVERSLTGQGGAPTDTASAKAAEAPAPQPEPSAAVKVSPILIESGLSFFVGFAIAYALRAIAKVLLVMAGIGLLAFFGLQYSGVIPQDAVNWSAFEGAFQSAAGAIQRWGGELQSYVAHALPSGAMAGLGFASGIKK